MVWIDRMREWSRRLTAMSWSLAVPCLFLGLLGVYALQSRHNGLSVVGVVGYATLNTVTLVLLACLMRYLKRHR